MANFYLYLGDRKGEIFTSNIKNFSRGQIIRIICTGNHDFAIGIIIYDIRRFIGARATGAN